MPEEKKKEKKMKKEKKENKKTKKTKQAVGPMHFTANNEPRALDVLGGLDPSVFNEVSIIFFIHLHIFSFVTSTKDNDAYNTWNCFSNKLFCLLV